MRLFLATANVHKVDEMRAILAGAARGLEVLPATVVGGMPHVVEDAGSFEGNARKKAMALWHRVSASERDPAAPWLCLADDSGLCVDALDGAPGVHSSRFSGTGGDTANTAKLLALLEAVPPAARTAAFHCCLVAVTPDGGTAVFDGKCPGHIVGAPRGAGGFGYDPVFVPEGFDLTFAELPSAVKNTMSHRARALAKFAAWLSA
jgi:XTP/dITP diphosphohydrolase